jgi:ribosomal-protein-alanine N-acetyltransferase
MMEIADERGLSHWTHENYIDEMARNDSILLKLSVDGEGLVGFLVGRTYAGSDDGSGLECEIYNIGLYRRFQGLGLGQRLFDAFLELCSGSGVKKIWLEVRASNERAITFYSRNGFVKHSVRKGFYSNPTEDSFVML